MNELQHRRYFKKVRSYGIPKYMAEDIVDTAIGASKGKDVDLYIHYAISLIYGIEHSKSKSL